jgi:hypothetical protein
MVKFGQVAPAWQGICIDDSVDQPTRVDAGHARALGSESDQDRGRLAAIGVVAHARLQAREAHFRDTLVPGGRQTIQTERAQSARGMRSMQGPRAIANPCNLTHTRCKRCWWP